MDGKDIEKMASQEPTTIEDFLIGLSSLDLVSFHMPGHKGMSIYDRTGHAKFFDKLANKDITEIPGADNLFQAEGIIEALQDRYAKLYGAKKSYLLVNGSSGGLLAAIMAVANPGDEVVVARNSHRAVFNGVHLGGIKPVHLQPSWNFEMNVPGPIKIEAVRKIARGHPRAKAIVIPSPNYYGILSDIEAIAKVAHEHEMVLIVDQAHGAHLKFFDKLIDEYQSAENQGADIVVNSIHKTLAGFTQSALLNVLSDRVDAAALEEKLAQVQSSSPSYLLLASLDINEQICRNQSDLFMEWKDKVDYFTGKVREEDLATLYPGAEFICDGYGKIIVSLQKGGRYVRGKDLYDLLHREFGIIVELYGENFVALEIGIGNTFQDFDRMVNALRKLKEMFKEISVKKDRARDKVAGARFEHDIDRDVRPGDPAEEVALEDVQGRTAAENVTPYPPGIPRVCLGEIYTEEDIGYLASLIRSTEKEDIRLAGVRDGKVRVFCQEESEENLVVTEEEEEKERT